MKYFFTALRIMGLVTAWSSKAMQDGKITIEEAAELAVGIADILGIPTDIQLPK